MITPLLLPFSLSFQRGDPIPMMNRTQYRSQRSRWTEVPLGAAPRFGIDERLLLPPVHGVGYGEDFKVSFALLGLQFITPWFPVVDDAHSLSRVEPFRELSLDVGGVSSVTEALERCEPVSHEYQ